MKTAEYRYLPLDEIEDLSATNGMITIKPYGEKTYTVPEEAILTDVNRQLLWEHWGIPSPSTRTYLDAKADELDRLADELEDNAPRDVVIDVVKSLRDCASLIRFQTHPDAQTLVYDDDEDLNLLWPVPAVAVKDGQ